MKGRKITVTARAFFRAYAQRFKSADTKNGPKKGHLRAALLHEIVLLRTRTASLGNDPRRALWQLYTQNISIQF